jgi:hypothetical protein
MTVMNSQFNKNLEPMVIALDDHESRELNHLMTQNINKKDNSHFLKDLSKVRSKVSSFKDRTQRNLSIKKYNASDILPDWKRQETTGSFAPSAGQK